MKTIRSTSPCKLIITGEHAVVYGSPALAVAIEPSCTASLREVETHGLMVRTFEITATEKKIKSELRRMDALNALLEHFKKKYGLQASKLELTLEIPQFKGIGSSASIAAAISKVLFTHLKITPTYQQLFNAVQVLEEVAHGGKASGIDASAVLRGAVRAEKENKNGKMKFTKMKMLSLPKGSELIVIDTKLTKPRQGTQEMVQIAAPNIAGNEENLTEFKTLFEKIEKQLKTNGDAQKLGQLFNTNHSLLAAIGVSTDGIELARGIALENGAYGAKITGAGGEGGAVVALVPIDKREIILKALRANNFTAFSAHFTEVN